jgi:hypothetical protein
MGESDFLQIAQPCGQGRRFRSLQVRRGKKLEKSVFWFFPDFFRTSSRFFLQKKTSLFLVGFRCFACYPLPNFFVFSVVKGFSLFRGLRKAPANSLKSSLSFFLKKCFHSIGLLPGVSPPPSFVFRPLPPARAASPAAAGSNSSGVVLPPSSHSNPKKIRKKPKNTFFQFFSAPNLERAKSAPLPAGLGYLKEIALSHSL